MTNPYSAVRARTTTLDLTIHVAELSQAGAIRIEWHRAALARCSPKRALELGEDSRRYPSWQLILQGPAELRDAWCAEARRCALGNNTDGEVSRLRPAAPALVGTVLSNYRRSLTSLLSERRHVLAFEDSLAGEVRHVCTCKGGSGRHWRSILCGLW